MIMPVRDVRVVRPTIRPGTVVIGMLGLSELSVFTSPSPSLRWI